MTSPQRTCIACRRKDDQARLIRLVRRGDDVVDATSPRLPGRGAYLHPECRVLAEQRHAIVRVFGAGAALAPDLGTSRVEADG